ncbi:Chloroperoxidase [Choanephora cucurbitarum]|nr:Chloroperoxidase [Choanephora cucurbitarum]
MSDIKRETEPHQKKWKISLQRLLSATLGAVLAYIVFHILSIETKGRQGLTTPEQWKQLIKSHPYERKPTDVRSPCPMLNTLANHGFIARDGRDIKLDSFFDAMMLMGAPPTVTYAFLKYVFVTYKEASPTSSFLSQFQSLESLDLHRLFVPRIIEHDVSLSRLDQGISNQTLPVPKLVERMTKIAHYKNQGKMKQTFTRRNENDARRIRWIESLRDNPTFHLSLFHQFASSTECSLLLDVIGREGQLATKHLESFLLHERFPEDWYPRETPLGIVDVLLKPMDCWIGLHRSKADLRLLDQI